VRSTWPARVLFAVLSPGGDVDVETPGLHSGGLEANNGLAVSWAGLVDSTWSARVLFTFLSPGDKVIEVPGRRGGYTDRDSGSGRTETVRSTWSARALFTLPSRARDPGPSEGVRVPGWIEVMRTADVPPSRGGDGVWVLGGGGPIPIVAVIADEGSSALGSVVACV
jgi:hypothetical protein